MLSVQSFVLILLWGLVSNTKNLKQTVLRGRRWKHCFEMQYVNKQKIILSTEISFQASNRIFAVWVQTVLKCHFPKESFLIFEQVNYWILFKTIFNKTISFSFLKLLAFIYFRRWNYLLKCLLHWSKSVNQCS